MICDRCGKQKNIRFRVSKYELCPLVNAPDCTGNGPKNTHGGRWRE